MEETLEVHSIEFPARSSDVENYPGAEITSNYETHLIYSITVIISSTVIHSNEAIIIIN